MKINDFWGDLTNISAKKEPMDTTVRTKSLSWLALSQMTSAVLKIK